ncbi:HAD family hydrolase [Ideonella sp.]|uniref:HAD family hydrolase n=1 Tax=Ideonella sp. TaxID=1929293 RepID=UPI0035B25F66
MSVDRPIRGLLLDLDDTLFDERSTAQRAFAAWQPMHGGHRHDESAEQAFQRWRLVTDKHWKRHSAGEISFLDQRRERLREFVGQALTDAQADALFEPYMQAYQSSWSLVDDAVEFLQRCAHLPKVIVTNGPRVMQERKLSSLGLNDHFVGMVTPDDCGHAKPRPEIFHRALGLIGLPASACLMVGDDHVCDIEPAHALGMAAFHIRPGTHELLGALALL